LGGRRYGKDQGNIKLKVGVNQPNEPSSLNTKKANERISYSHRRDTWLKGGKLEGRIYAEKEPG